MRNVHGMFIYIYIYIYITENIGSRKTRNDFFVQVRNFLLPLCLKVLRHKEREAQSFYASFFICAPTISCPRPPRASESQQSRPVSSLNSPNFLQISQNLPYVSGAWRHSLSVTPFPISGYCDISEWHVRPARAHVNTFVNVAPK